jgi:hypothetical protein
MGCLPSRSWTTLGLSNFEIECILKNEKYFSGVFASDTLPKHINPNDCGIINLSKIAAIGTHWVSYYNSPESPYVEYFDSFGLPPSKSITLFLNTSGKPIIYNDTQLQLADSVLCGLYCIYFLQLRNLEKSYADILNTFKQKPSLLNELKVLKPTG